MQPLSSDQIMALFPGERHADIAPPNVETVDWGVLDYLGWIHPAGHRGFAVIPFGDDLRGLSLTRTLHSRGRPRSQMCNWCNFVHRSRGAAMFSATVAGSNGRRIVGHLLCRNLDCSVRIRNLTGDTPAFMPETLHLSRKVERLENALLGFLARVNRL